MRAALQQLARDGLVTRSPKRGTYSAEQMVIAVNELLPVSEFSSDTSIPTELRMLEQQIITCPPMVGRRLSLLADEWVLMIEALVLQADVPLGLMVTYIPVGPDRPDEIVVDEADPIVYLEKRLGVRIASSDLTIGATAADKQSAQLIGVDPGSPMMYVEELVRDAQGSALALDQFRFRSDRVAFRADAQRSA